MATARQIEANRRNAQKSTGPRTAAGKARSARNALKYGPMPRLGPDDQPRIDAIVEALVGEIGASRDDAARFAKAQRIAERMELGLKKLHQRLLAPHGGRIVHVTALAPFYLREERARRRRSRAFRKMIEAGGISRERRWPILTKRTQLTQDTIEVRYSMRKSTCRPREASDVVPSGQVC
jgi:hypothetical protein